MGEKSACNAGETENLGLITGSRRAPGLGNGNPLQYSSLKNLMDRGTENINSPKGQKESDRTEHTGRRKM